MKRQVSFVQLHFAIKLVSYMSCHVLWHLCPQAAKLACFQDLQKEDCLHHCYSSDVCTSDGTIFCRLMSSFSFLASTCFAGTLVMLRCLHSLFFLLPHTKSFLKLVPDHLLQMLCLVQELRGKANTHIYLLMIYSTHKTDIKGAT